MKGLFPVNESEGEKVEHFELEVFWNVSLYEFEGWIDVLSRIRSTGPSVTHTKTNKQTMKFN